MSEVKPGFLDQFLLEDISRHCPHQLLAFHQCMAAPDANKCAQQQVDLSRCIKTSVPSFAKIQTVCSGKMQAYEACLKMNKGNTKSCTHELDQLRTCAFGTVDRKK